MEQEEQKLGALFYPGDVPFDALMIPYIYNEIYFEGIYIDVLNGQTEMTVIDVGANIGIVTDHMRHHAKKVYAIEPSPEHFAALKKNKEFNNWDNVEIFNIAISDKVGEANLKQNPGNLTMNSIMVGEKDPKTGRYHMEDGKYSIGVAAGYTGGTAVPTVDFATFFEQNKIEKVDFIKFDVEGAEDVILRSESFRKIADKISAIEVEFHYPTWPSLAEYMQSLGFSARRYQASAVIILFSR